MKISDLVDTAWAFGKKVFTDCFTERDGVSWCWVRFTATGGCLTLTWAFIHDPSRIQHLQDYGIAVGALAAAVGFKNISERDK
jgi:hypothetical protein